MPSMDHNLIPPFIMRAGGVTVHDTAKNHCDNPTVNDHCIKFNIRGELKEVVLSLLSIVNRL